MPPRPAPLPLPRATVTASELARRLGLSIKAFHRERGRLHIEVGLPAALRRVSPMRWDRPTIEAWLASANGKAKRDQP